MQQLYSISPFIFSYFIIRMFINLQMFINHQFSMQKIQENKHSNSGQILTIRTACNFSFQNNPIAFEFCLELSQFSSQLTLTSKNLIYIRPPYRLSHLVDRWKVLRKIIKAQPAQANCNLNFTLLIIIHSYTCHTFLMHNSLMQLCFLMPLQYFWNYSFT